MLQIAICDDDARIRDTLQDYLARFSAASGVALSAACYSDGQSLLASDYNALDLLILDIQMSGLDGLETARAIRTVNTQLNIIFFTNYIQYALEGYTVQAYRFLLKPLNYEQFSDVVGTALLDLQERRQAMLVVRTRTQTSQIPVGSILYAETWRGHVRIHTRDDIIECFSTMKEIEEKLKEHLFFRCHTAFLVSLREIQTITQQDVLLQNGQAIPLSKHRRKALKEAVTVFWGEKFL